MTGTQQGVALDGPVWSLVHEMRISLIFPLLILLCRDTRLALVAAAIMLVVSTRTLLALDQGNAWAVKKFWVTILWTVRIVPYFVYGILLSKHSDNIRRFMQRVPAPIRIALLAVPIIGFTISNHYYLSIRRDALYDISAAIVVVWALNIPSITAILNRAVPQWLGRISYSLYLIHWPILCAMAYALHGRVPLWFIIVAVIVASLIAATLMHRFVEVPAIKLGQRVARGTRATTTPIGAAAESG